MHAITPLDGALVRARDDTRWDAANHARRVREYRSPATPRNEMVWRVLPLAVLLGLVLGVGTVTVSQADQIAARHDAGRITVGTVVTVNAMASGVSVSALIQASVTGSLPVPGMGAPGKAGTVAIADPTP